jgi:NADH-quinone oxidoreductase subunit M
MIFENALLSVFLIPTLSIPFVYFAAKKSDKLAAMIIVAIALASMMLILSTIPAVLNNPDHRYLETYTWITLVPAEFSLFTDGISISVSVISLALIAVAALFSINYMAGKKNLPVYYALLCMLPIGLVGVFLTSNLLLFYFCWELMLVPAYFILGEWGYRASYKAALKFFIFTHAGAVFVLLGIGATYVLSGTMNIFDAQAAMMATGSDLVKWIIVALTAGFAVKMAVVPVHMWLPDAHSEAPATLSALLSGVIISAGAYAILRLSFGMVFPAIADVIFRINFLHALAIIGIISAFFGGLLALVETDIKRLIAYSSIAHMGYIMFGLSLFPVNAAMGTTVLLSSAVAITGTVLHIITHAVSKGLFFFTAGGVMHQTEERDITRMGGLAGKMPFSAVSGAIAALSIGGTPPFAVFISEFLIFVGAVQVMQTDSFYVIPTVLMLIATVISLAYSLRFISKVFLGKSRDEISTEEVKGEAERGVVHKIKEVPTYMKISMAVLVVLVILIGIYPTFFMELIQTVSFG